MPKTLLFINLDAANAQVAVTEDGELKEYYVEQRLARQTVGNIYRGRVVNVLPGMQAAFVDIGLERNAFLFVGESPLNNSEIAPAGFTLPQSLTVRQGDEIMVQVVKEEAGSKGARVSQHVSLPGRYLVATPSYGFIVVSRRITDERERQRLIGIAEKSRKSRCGYIIRTAAAGVPAKAIESEVRALERQYAQILADYTRAKPGSEVYSEGDLVMRTIRDAMTEELSEILTNSAEIADEVRAKLRGLGMKAFADRVKYYDKTYDMLAEYGVRDRVAQLLDRKVGLPGGGYLIIDKTEALTVIDVNSGKFTGGTDLEDTVYKVNIEAAREIARQLRLRNMGGIIVADFIDMENPAHKGDVVAALSDELSRDRIRSKVAGMTGLGLVEITRKKIRNDVGSYFSENCIYCAGHGRVQSAEYVADRIRIYLQKFFTESAANAALVKCHADVKKKLFTGLLSKEIGTVWALKRIYIADDPAMHREKFAVQSLSGPILSVPDNATLLY